MDMSADVVLPADWAERVRAALPSDLRSGSLRLLGAGLDSVALVLRTGGADLVLRLPRSSGGAAGIEVEARLLPRLADRLPVAVPRFAFTAPNPLGPGHFCAYPLVPGESLSVEQWTERGLLERSAPARQVAEIIDAVHAFPVDVARECGVPEEDPRADFTGDLEQVRVDLLPLLPAEAAGTLVRAWEGYLADDANFAFDPGLIHADVSLDHLLVATDRISGLIDFGDVAIGDPDYDLSFLWAQAGPGFVRRVQQHRGGPWDDRLTAKLRFWALADPAGDVLHGIENDMPEFRDRSLRLLLDRLTAP